MSPKRWLKDHLPQKVVYAYLTARQVPGFIRACRRHRQKIPLTFLDDRQTVDLLLEKRMSLSRFGDGEIRWMFGQNLPSFQQGSPELARELGEVFQSRQEKLLIGLPRGLVDTRGYTLYAKLHWGTIRGDFLQRLARLGARDRVYCDASITRPYMDYRSRRGSAARFANLRRLWQGREIVIVEGRKTRLGMGNDLFDNAAAVRRILCPAVNAYEKIDAIEKTIHNLVSRDTLLLAALGPTATVLAARLCGAGYQMVDIGHIDVEYTWFLRGDVLRKPIAGKHVNESGVDSSWQGYDQDPVYRDSILCTIE